MTSPQAENLARTKSLRPSVLVARAKSARARDTNLVRDVAIKVGPIPSSTLSGLWILTRITVPNPLVMENAARLRISD